MPRLLELVEAAEDFADRQAELRAVAARDLPPPAAAGGQLDAHADLRPHADLLGVLEDQPSSVYFSTTGMIWRPIFWASIAISMNSASLKPLQMIGVSFDGHAP